TPSSDPMDPSQTPSTDSQQQTPETPETPEQPTQPQTQNNQTSPNSSNQNLSASTSSSSQQVAPGMIGDFFGTGPIGTGRLQTDSFHASLQPVMIPGGGIYMLPATEH
ncbi:MAG: hypothetical protein KDA80_02745, partial [Planctomycetaceae bacterium]|nr:hypothetical protein [Planctomycetaceae bacterium]